MKRFSRWKSMLVFAAVSVFTFVSATGTASAVVSRNAKHTPGAVEKLIPNIRSVEPQPMPSQRVNIPTEFWDVMNRNTKVHSVPVKINRDAIVGIYDNLDDVEPLDMPSVD